MDGKRPRGPEEQGMVPQGPEDAVEDGDRGELRRQVMNSACSKLGDCDFYIGDEKFCDEKWTHVCVLSESDQESSGENNCTVFTC